MEKKTKLLLHIPSSDRWDVGATNAINFLKSKRDNEELSVKIVGNSEAVTISAACDGALYDKLRQIVLDGGEIVLCEFALSKFGIKKEQLADIFKTVPGGIRAITDAIEDGWIYVRP
jgi:intracellular sulfur oxidation DsrE/DsrF family protein